ncbi:geranylgeranyl pyrophosphate synthase [Boudabousia liubingyangii]|uniref:Geranylgeranyl pyrophosphate synthase n=1 Tax=Boudabousia liubingyangii TaxID=1921764 RepID=A0A1Q5PQ80_9ACTO|nr:polyprenyl synthetase family protein [Boudabousia liubingyangii]OKL48288.1 geranylgeranyl pyrophosphate synthase [Boudabousia liubingyangii]OKL49676.1 geranylgeranyl pyrophosphate synthase [Boudabousia liubingyangii]
MSTIQPNLDMPELQQRIEPLLQSVEELLLEQVQGSSDLVDPLTKHLAVAGGKRMRPLLVMLCGQIGPQPDPEHLVKAAASVELTHLATLYHDDVMDSAPQRRGVSAAQIEWGNNRAILAGDVLFARASRLVAALGPEAVDFHAATFERLCLGQLNETFGPKQGEDKVDFYLQVLADKTGSLVASAASFGAMFSGASEEIREAVALYGDRVGVAFQIADDILDLTSPGEVSGKTPGTDLREGVDTLPVLLLRRQAANGEGDSAVAQILDALAGDLSSDEALAHVVGLIKENPVMEKTRALAKEWVDSAIDALGPVPEGEAKEALVAFANLMVDRVS